MSGDAEAMGAAAEVDEDAVTRHEAPAPTPPLATTKRPPLAGSPLSIGRYTILRELGSGGMGVVYSAYDDELDRRIALKVLSERIAGGSLGRERMLREAQALARLSHPNVVQVYEVGEVDGRLYLAMEYIEGLDLKKWRGASPRSWRQILEVYIQAGRGLAAAHAAGLIHRDFKPQNAIVGDDGRVRVLDFGLARGRGEATAAADASPPGDPSEVAELGGISRVEGPGWALASRLSARLCDGLTDAETLLGTPAYMAPEQLDRQPADARSDLFAFCVALWEALYGQRPFVAPELTALRAAISRGPPPPPPGRTPARIARILAQGLAVNPENRPTDLTAHLAALTRAAEAGRRRGVAAATFALLAATAGLSYQLARSQVTAPPTACADASDLTALWGPEPRAAVATVFQETSTLPYAAATWAAIAPRLDAYAAALAAMETRACVTRAASPIAGSPVLHAQERCLHRRRLGFAATVEVLTRGDAGAIAGALRAVEGLDPLAPCEDPAALLAAARGGDDETHEARLATLEAIERLLAASQAESNAENFSRARELAAEALELETTEGLDHPRLRALALLHLSRAHEGAGEFSRATETAAAAYAAAELADDDLAAFDAATALLRLEGREPRDASAARIWEQVATAKLGRSGGDLRRQIILLLEAGVAANEIDRRGAGAPQIREAVALAEASQTIPETLKISANNALASGVLKFEGALTAAQKLTETTLARHIALLGPDHPYNGMLIYNLGVLRYELHDLKGAHEAFERSLAIREGAYGPLHPEVAQSLNGLAAALGDLGRPEEAIPFAQRSLAIDAGRRGDDHSELCYPLNNLAILLIAAGRLDEAEVHLQRALAILEARGLENNNLAAMVTETAATLARARGDHTAALAALRRSLAIAEATQGPGSPSVGELHRSLASLLLLELDRPDEAAPHLATALEILAAAPDATIQLAKAQLLEARRRWRRPATRPEALALAQAAAAAIEPAEGAQGELAEVKAALLVWLADPGP